ncbi:MAG: hybrid sensor histidine kinase/response regulator [Gemmatimonadales bacterium]|nr:MAG: hybrid sensor histidine kinase/response regulator [Gemmatimonadales bacterium]
MLVVDDEKPIVSYLATVLTREGCAVLTAEGGREALSLLRVEAFDLVLCDLAMPDIDGLRVLKEMQNYQVDAAFVMMTAYGTLRSAIEAMQLGAYDYLTKPFEYDELVERVRVALDRHGAWEKREEWTRELEAFIFAISHDIAGHLVSLRGFGRRLKEKCSRQLSDECRVHLELMDSSAENMERLISAISDFARAGSPVGRREMIDVNKVVQEVLLSFQNAIEERGVTVEIERVFPTVELEWINVYQVFHNLIGNAIKFSRESGTPRICIGMDEMDQYYRFHVQDNGPGVRRDEREKIFELFGRGTESKVPGTGLGLAIVKRIIDKFGGRIWVESTEGEGSTFYFTMPKQAEQENSHAA